MEGGDGIAGILRLCRTEEGGGGKQGAQVAYVLSSAMIVVSSCIR